MDKTIQEVVAEKISNSGQLVKETVINKLAEVEVSNRVALITKAIEKQDALEIGLKKINKCDVVTYVGDNQTEVMSKARFEQIKKEKEKIERVTKAIDFALTQNTTDSYNKLSETLKKIDGGGNKNEGSGDSE